MYFPVAADLLSAIHVVCHVLAFCSPWFDLYYSNIL